MAAAGSGRVEVGTRVVGRDMMSAWIHRNVGGRVSATSGIHHSLILSLVVEFFARVIAFWFSHGR